MVSRPGDGPRNGLGNKLYRLGMIRDGKCPDCNADNIDNNLTPAGDSTLACPKGHTFQAGEVP